MKLSAYVIERLAQEGVDTIFGISGGAAVHLFDAIGRHPTMRYVAPSHEQTAAMAADGYARTSGRIGVALTTSGPGATNLLTGLCCSYDDGIPTVMLTGQVATHRLRGDLGVRQLGFQETPIVEMYAPVTKYAVRILEPTCIRYELEKALYLAQEGRPGPVVIDLPDDLQRVEIDPLALEGFTPPPLAQSPMVLDRLRALVADLERAARPVAVLGAGLLRPRLDRELAEFIEAFGLPMLTTWPASDLVPANHPLRIGPFGVYGPRSGNFAVQHADFVLVLGSRLSQNLTGGLLPTFAPKATIAMIDIDPAEIEKFTTRGIRIVHRIPLALQTALPEMSAFASSERLDRTAWLTQIAAWRERYPAAKEPRPPAPTGTLDAYDVVTAWSAQLPARSTIVVDTGGTLTWTLNGYAAKVGQRLFSAWNTTPMGYALPAAIGASFADPTRTVSCIIGDGGLMLCLGELAMLVRHRLPIKVLLFDNHGHGIQRQTLDTWLQGAYHAVDEASGLSFVPFSRVAEAIGLPVIHLSTREELNDGLRRVYAMDGPVFCHLEIAPRQPLYPVLKYGYPLEEQMPF